MGIINFYVIRNWKENGNKFVENAPCYISVMKGVERVGRTNEYLEYHQLNVYTKFKEYKFTIYYKLMKNKNNKIIRVDDDVYLSDFTWFQEVSDFDNKYQLIVNNLNHNNYYTNNIVSFVKMEHEQGKYFEIDETRIENLKNSPYKLLCAEVLYENDDTQELGINWYINDEVKLQFIIHNRKTKEKRIIQVPDYENYPGEPTLRLEKEIEDTYSNESAYLKITNKKTRQTQKFYYHEKLGIV